MSDMIKHFQRNTVGRDLIVGDIHGCFSKLQSELERVRFDHERDRLFSVGDMVDRGAQSPDVLEWLQKPWFFAVSGNHEQMALEYSRGAIGLGMYAANGGHWFVGMTPQEQVEYVEWFSGLPLAIELETEQGLVAIVHAEVTHSSWDAFKEAIDGGSELVRQAVIDMTMWGRSRISNLHDFGEVAGVRAVVVGHTPVDSVTRINNVIHIDTGGWLKGGRGPERFTLLDAATLRPAS